MEHLELPVAGVYQVLGIRSQYLIVELGDQLTLYHPLHNAFAQLVLYLFLQRICIVYVSSLCQRLFLRFLFNLLRQLFNYRRELLALHFLHHERVGNCPELFTCPRSVERFALFIYAIAVNILVKRTKNLHYFSFH